jgi:hypothetical protein
MENIEINLEIEGNGWLNIKLNVGSFKYEYVASDLGKDPVVYLVYSALKALDSETEYGSETIECYGEPTALNIVLWDDEGKFRISVYYLEDIDLATEGDSEKRLFSGYINKDEYASAIYKSVSDLIRSKGLLFYSRHWHEFPIGSYLALHQALSTEPEIIEGSIESELEALSDVISG